MKQIANQKILKNNLETGQNQQIFKQKIETEQTKQPVTKPELYMLKCGENKHVVQKKNITEEDYLIFKTYKLK